jgi:hypothetical protein
MRKLFAIVLCTTFVFATLNVFGQKPKKPIQTTNSTSTAARVQSSLDKPASTTPACWMITGKNGDIEYRWDTEANVRQWINEMRTQHNEIYEYTTSTAKDVDACDAKNEKQNPKKCWKITAKKNSENLEQYLWSTETVARRKVSLLRSEGYQDAKYVETQANDENSCANGNEEPACWEVTIGNTVSYIWDVESTARNMVNSARNSGQTASYTKNDFDYNMCIKYGAR